ncbi:MAG: thermonuclease family protein [Candidatus Omnitrophota bacterium]|nr:thermonuclease family protein [Candidatus Omnitrophota bacterium]
MYQLTASLPNFNISQLTRLIKLILISLLSFYTTNCQRLDYNAVRVKQVIDGDTIILFNNQHVRYIGIDTPELRKNINGVWVYEPMPFAEDAKDFNQRLVEGKLVRLEFDLEKKDKYNRLLAYCFVGETFVNAKLLEEGLSLIYTRPPNIKYVNLFVKLQKQARENKKGFWREVKIVPAQLADKFIGSFKTVEGKVKNTSISDKAIHLNFGKDYKNDFSAVIFKQDLTLFDTDTLVKNNFYRGKKLRITGFIKDYQGPEIIVNHPSQIENLN